MDGRHPLFYQHPDLTDMVTKQRKKIMVSLLNKADLVAKADRARWTLYFQDVGVHAIWYSCKSEQVESKKDTQDIEKIYSTSQMLAQLHQLAYNQEHEVNLDRDEEVDVKTFKNIAFVGWPNVGKSSVINNIMEYDL